MYEFQIFNDQLLFGRYSAQHYRMQEIEDEVLFI